MMAMSSGCKHATTETVDETETCSHGYTVGKKTTKCTVSGCGIILALSTHICTQCLGVT
jgi:hypothetical protein